MEQNNVSPSKKPKPTSKPQEQMNISDGDYKPASETETATRIFDLLSSRTDIDHPICTDCTDLLVNNLQKRLAAANRERDAHIQFLRQINASDVPTDEEIATAQSQLRQSQREESTALKDLRELEAERSALEEELLKLDEEMLALDDEEEAFWAERNEMASKVAGFRAERDAVAARAEHDEAMLRRLQRANVYNDAFSIGHDGFFGTINGLRLGRLPDKPVEWGEINAAWGHALLLLDTVAGRLGFQFRGYRLMPMGSTSKILEILPANAKDGGRRGTGAGERIKEHELFSSSDYSISLSLFSRKFDGAMVAYLECLRQLIHYAQTTEFVKVVVDTPSDIPDSPTPSRTTHQTSSDAEPVRSKRMTVNCPEIPYKIDKDKIGEHSIKLGGFSQEEESWTKACKAVLICCKYLLAHASNVEEFKAESEG
jgi:beclin 1